MISQPEHMRVIISGGGTGGHIFPAIAIADSLKLKQTNIDILFVGAKGRMEEKKCLRQDIKLSLFGSAAFREK